MTDSHLATSEQPRAAQCYICHQNGPAYFWQRFWLCGEHYASILARYQATKTRPCEMCRAGRAYPPASLCPECVAYIADTEAEVGSER